MTHNQRQIKKNKNDKNIFSEIFRLNNSGGIKGLKYRKQFTLFTDNLSKDRLFYDTWI